MRKILPLLCVSLFFFACPDSEETINSGLLSTEANSSSSVEVVGGDCTFTDSRDNKTYKCVKIGNQTWMAENLNYAGTDGKLGTCERRSFHEPVKTLDCDAYGRLYTWNEMPVEACTKMYCGDGTNDCNTCVGGICPEGWRLPSKVKWEELIAFAGGEEIAGKKLKAKEGWIRYGKEDNGTDDYGFSALAAGKSPESPPFSCPQPECPPCEASGEKVCVQCPVVACAPPRPDGIPGETGWWWTATAINADEAFSLVIGSYYRDGALLRNYEKSYRMSVRCVKN